MLLYNIELGVVFIKEYLQIKKTVIDVGLKKEYKFFQISDAHITVLDNQSSDVDKADYERCRKQWHKMKQDFAKQFGEFCDERYDGEPTVSFERLMQYAKSNNFDSIIWSGDIIDRVTESSIRYIKDVLDKSEIPIIYCPGNHESIYVDGTHTRLYEKLKPVMDKPAFDKVDFDEFKVITIDNATKDITDEQLDLLSKEVKEEKKILLVVHAPICIGEFGREAISKFGSYFVMGIENDPPNTHKLIDIINNNIEKFICILAGHVHTNFEASVSGNLKQITTSSALIGVGREIILK